MTVWCLGFTGEVGPLGGTTYVITCTANCVDVVNIYCTYMSTYVCVYAVQVYQCTTIYLFVDIAS